MLVVGIDCWALRLNGGGARYVFESIFTHLSKSKDIKWILFLHPEASECIYKLQETEGLFKNAIKIVINSPEDISKYDKYVDVYYSPFNNISFRYFTKPVVSLLHDVQERYLPELFNSNDLEGRLEDYDDIVRSSSRTITISNFCKQSLIDFCDAESNKVDVIYNAPQEGLIKYTNSISLKDTKNNFGLSSNNYIFYPANFYIHKNHKRLLEAYSHLLKTGTTLPPLVLMGKGFNQTTDINDMIDELQLTDHIVIVSDLSSKNVAWLYMHCRFVVIPTLFEGFCMPAVEAIAFGKQILCSNLDILKEVTEHQAFCFDPYNVEDIAIQISKLLVSNEKNNMVKSSSKYNWAVSATKTIEVLQSALVEYVPEKIKSVAKRSCFTMIINCENVNAYDLEFTLKSLSEQSDNVGALKVLLNGENTCFDNFDFISNKTSSLEVIVCKSLSLLKEQINNQGSKSSDNYFACINAGNQISKNYFVNVISGLHDRSSTLIVGEVHQVHEDEARTFEAANYFRKVRGNLVLKGTLYPEMFVSKSHEYLLTILDKPCAIWEYFLSSKNNNEVLLARVNLASCIYKTSINYMRNKERVKAINYSPETLLRPADVKNIELLRKNNHFLNMVNTTVAQKLGCIKPPQIDEIDIILKQVSNTKEESNA